MGLAEDLKNTLIIGDTHFPYEHPQYLDHCLRTRDKYKCEAVIHIGDMVDNLNASAYPKDADADSASQEFKAAYDKVQLWQRKFGKAILITGNHDVRVLRAANRSNLLPQFLRSYSDVWGLKSWKTLDQITLRYGTQEVLFTHGEGLGGGHSAMNNAIQKHMTCVVFGHLHSTAGVVYRQTLGRLLWAMAVGSGISRESVAMRYAVNNKLPQITSCGVLTSSGVPTVIPLLT